MEEKAENHGFVLPRMGQGEQVLSLYEIELNGVTKGRGSLLIHSKDGVFMLKEFRGSKEKAAALAGVLQQLHCWDDKNEQLIATAEGDYLVKEEYGPGYILKTVEDGRECDVKQPLELMEGVRKLADLHLALKEISLEGQKELFLPEHSWSQEVERHNKEFRKLKNYIRRKRQKTFFEELFWQQEGMFSQQAIEIEQQLQNRRWMPQEACLCHGDYHYHNVFDCSSRSFLAHYENMRWDTPIADLAKYVRKAMEKNHWKESLGVEMIAAYHRICPMTKLQEEELLLRLSYPEKFWKIINHYSNSKKAWASKRDGEKLKQLIAQEEKRQQFLGVLCNGWQ